MALRQAVDPFRYRFILLETVTCRVAVSAFFDDDRDSKSPDVNRDTHSAPPSSRRVGPTACRCAAVSFREE